ncbi:MAG: FAD:protein FMN transferase [Prevotella shahii]|jgi:thiamine biosynthesis lipoprotein apbE|uniref:FAD:protein FMN transferase n=1 Tax=Hoylesella shahii TaxID=228603 RepID=UPI001CAAE850|nr:FAD:protein FMN transferase [Hoylesella shahii]MBF1567734.1 FAD:protein FMN transferase [Hoylesella shahii]
MNTPNRKRRLLWQIPFLLLLIIGTIYIIKQQQDTPYQHDRGTVFGTTYSIIYQSNDNLNKEIMAALNEVDQSMSTFNKGSVISKINRNEQVQPDKMFADVFQLAEKISNETNGAFDVTVAPLVNAWGFGFKSGVRPTPHAIDSIKQFIGYKKVSYVDGRIKKKDPRLMLDFSAIAKGYGSDVVASLLKRKGIENFMVEIGGEIVTRGISEKRLPWKVGVTKPSDDSLNVNQELQTILNVTNKAMATSGNYRKFYYKNGKKYAHTIDPMTGYPVQHNILSSTVLASNCAEADAYATAFMVLGLEKAQKVLNQHPELMAYFIYSDKDGKNAVWFSSSLKDKIQK